MARAIGEALRIMNFMVRDGHIDKDLFDMLVRSGEAREYAHKYLLKEQLDEVNVATLFD